MRSCDFFGGHLRVVSSETQLFLRTNIGHLEITSKIILVLLYWYDRLLLFRRKSLNIVIMKIEDNSEVSKLIGDRIRQLRLEHNDMSQDELAFQSNLSTSQVSKMERGKINPSILSITQVCTAFNITLKEFFSGMEYPRPKKKSKK
jgi:DNA-binding XRE family transcriptional regulator